MSLEHFFDAIPDNNAGHMQNLIPYFVYYLTVERKIESATAKEVAECFDNCSLVPPNRIPQNLSTGTRGKKPIFIKAARGYKLHRTTLNRIAAELGKRKVILQTSNELRSLESMLPANDSLTFLREAVDCFEAGANRAAIIMTWVLTVDHLQNYIFKHQLEAFNAAIAAHSDKKMKMIADTEDFNEMREVRFLELIRTAKIVSADELKILDVALGIRNSCAHPSVVAVKTSKAISTIEDLVTNIIAKFVV